MAKNNKKEVKKAYKNPVKTIWGKVIILVLAAAMALSGLLSLIVLLFQ